MSDTNMLGLATLPPEAKDEIIDRSIVVAIESGGPTSSDMCAIDQLRRVLDPYYRIGPSLCI
jgi:hypothetical protein